MYISPRFIANKMASFLLRAPSLTHAWCMSVFTLVTDMPRRWPISLLVRCLPLE